MMPLWNVDRIRQLLIYCDPEGQMIVWPFKLAATLGFNVDVLSLTGVGLPDFTPPQPRRVR